MSIDQIIIALTGVSSSWLIHSSDRKVRLIACALALAGQPAWLYAAIVAHQWGILIVDVLFTAGWIRGLKGNRNV